MGFYTLALLLVTLFELGHCRNLQQAPVLRDDTTASVIAASAAIPLIPAVLSPSRILLTTPAPNLEAALVATSVQSPQAQKSALEAISAARGSVPARLLTVTETPVRWCGEDDDKRELTWAELEAGSGSDELPPELRGIVTDEWRKNHPDEQLSDDDPLDSYELENTRVEVLL